MSDLTDSKAYYDWLDEVLSDPDACPSCGGELFKIEEHRGVVCCARCGFIVGCYDDELKNKKGGI